MADEKRGSLSKENIVSMIAERWTEENSEEKRDEKGLRREQVLFVIPSTPIPTYLDLAGSEDEVKNRLLEMDRMAELAEEGLLIDFILLLC